MAQDSKKNTVLIVVVVALFAAAAAAYFWPRGVDKVDPAVQASADAAAKQVAEEEAKAGIKQPESSGHFKRGAAPVK